MAESYRSGDSASLVARRHGVHTSVLFRWRRRYRTSADTDAGLFLVVVDAPEHQRGNACSLGRRSQNG